MLNHIKNKIEIILVLRLVRVGISLYDSSQGHLKSFISEFKADLFWKFCCIEIDGFW
jgi:hypothetical protein